MYGYTGVVSCSFESLILNICFQVLSSVQRPSGSMVKDT